MIVKQISIHIDFLNKIDKIKHLIDSLDISNDTNKVTFLIDEEKINELDKLNLKYNIIQDNVTKNYENRLISYKSRINKDINIYGSMGYYMTFKEIVNKIDSLYEQFPQFISKKMSIGKSVEGRDIWILHVSLNSLNDWKDKPEILITGLHHSREVITYTSILYYIEWICKNYHTDPEAKHILDKMHLWFVPCVNPDGLVYNQTIARNGGGLFRKNRRPNTDNPDYIGVDLNRNYSYKWKLNESGSSSNPDSYQFRGTSEFSEPETWALALFVKSRNIVLNINHHSYGNALLHPYGYSLNNDLEAFEEKCYTNLSKFVIEKLPHYTYGSGGEIYYPVNGDASDWFHHKEHDKKCILSFTTELGSNEDGFWPKPNRIIPICQDAKIITNRLCLLCQLYYTITHELTNDTIILTIKNISCINPKKNSDFIVNYDNNIIKLEQSKWSFKLNNNTETKLTIPINFVHNYFLKTQISINIIDDENQLYKPYTIDIYNQTYLNDNPELTTIDANILLDYQNNKLNTIKSIDNYSMEDTIKLYLDVDNQQTLENIINNINSSTPLNSSYISNILDSIYN